MAAHEVPGVIITVLLDFFFFAFNKCSSNTVGEYPTIHSCSLKQITRNMLNPFIEATHRRHELHEQKLK